MSAAEDALISLLALFEYTFTTHEKALIFAGAMLMMLLF